MRMKISNLVTGLSVLIRSIKILFKYPPYLHVRREGRYYRVHARFPWKGALVEFVMRPTGSVELLIDHVRVKLGEMHEQAGPPETFTI